MIRLAVGSAREDEHQGGNQENQLRKRNQPGSQASVKLRHEAKNF